MIGRGVTPESLEKEGKERNWKEMSEIEAVYKREGTI